MFIIRRARILQKPEHGRQENKGREQGPDQPVPEEADPVQDHLAEMAQPMQPCRAPDRVQDCHDHHHVEEVEIAHGCDKYHEQEQPGFLFAQIQLAADQQQGKEYKGVQKIMMPHARHGESVENIDQRACEHTDPALFPHEKTVGAERDTGQPEPHQQHQIMKEHQAMLRNKDRGQAEGISDHIVGQGRVQVLAISHPQCESRYLQNSCLAEIPQHLFPPSGKI